MVDKTLTGLFMRPTLGIPMDILEENGYIESYSRDLNQNYKDVIYLLFKPIDLDRFRHFLETEYDRTVDIVDDYDYENGHVVIVYSLNPAYKTDFDLIKKGKYSETSKIFQELFKEKVNIKIEGLSSTEKSFQNMVFNKSPVLIEYWTKEADIDVSEENEYWSVYDIDKETLKL